MDVDSFISWYKVFVRSHLEYAESVWNPHYMYLIDDVEKVQKWATKILRQCRRLNHRHHLKFLNLPTLAFRRNRGDVTEVYQILTGKYDPALSSISYHNINSTSMERHSVTATCTLVEDLIASDWRFSLMFSVCLAQL